MTLVSAACIADLAGIDLCSADPSTVRQLTRIAARASAEAVAAADRPLCAEYMIKEAVEPCGDSLYLSRDPVMQVHSVECCECGKIEDYCLEGNTVRRCCGFASCTCIRKSVQVCYTAGYVTEAQSKDPESPFFKCPVTLPADLEGAVCDLALGLWATACIPQNVTSVKILSESISFSSTSTVSAASMSVFDRYRRGCVVV